MSDAKYLSDGRKVAVIGRLNNEEYIVQEVFVAKDGAEIPSGERFTAKSLHDQPLESYKSREEQRCKERITRIEAKEKELNRKIKQTKDKLSALDDMLKSTTALAEALGEDNFEDLVDLATGKCKWAVIEGYGMPTLKTFEDALTALDTGYYGNGRYEGIRLLSIFGDSNGDIRYRVSQYRDGSGSYDRVSFFKTRDEALEKIKSIAQDKVECERFSYDDYQNCLKLGVEFDRDTMNDIAKLIKDSSLKSIARYAKEIEKEKGKIEKEKLKIVEAEGINSQVTS